MEQQQPTNDNQLPGHEVNDGRQDIVIGFEGIDQMQLLVGQELYTDFKYTYEEMKTKEGLAKFLMTYGTYLMLTAGHKDLLDIPKLLTDYKKLHDLAEYFVARCEGRPVPEGHGQIMSKKAYAKFKGVLDEIKGTNKGENTPNANNNNGEDTTSSVGIS